MTIDFKIGGLEELRVLVERLETAHRSAVAPAGVADSLRILAKAVADIAAHSGRSGFREIPDRVEALLAPPTANTEENA